MLMLAISIVLNVAGQLLLRRAAMAGSAPDAAVAKAYLSPYFVGGVAMLGFSMLLWVQVLRKMPLTLAHPISAIAFILVPVGARVLWGEPLTLLRMIGILVILAGVVIVARSAS